MIAFYKFQNQYDVTIETVVGTEKEYRVLQTPGNPMRPMDNNTALSGPHNSNKITNNQ